MPIAKITGQGLAAITLSVALLWSCFVAERLISQRSLTRRAQVMRELRQLQLQQHRAEPASTPVRRFAHPSRTTVG
jgi:hypothetical protein